MQVSGVKQHNGKDERFRQENWIAREHLMGTIKGRNSKDLTETKEIKKRRQEYTVELYKKGRNAQITTMVWSLT